MKRQTTAVDETPSGYVVVPPLDSASQNRLECLRLACLMTRDLNVVLLTAERFYAYVNTGITSYASG